MSTEAPTRDSQHPTGPLDRIPLAVRMTAYCVAFLAAILGLLPWAASLLDARLPAAWRLDLPVWFRIVATVVFVTTLGVYLTASVLLSRRGRGAYVEFDPPREFVAEGPFRWCRNPIAACVLGMLWAEALALSSTGVLLLAILAVPLAHLQVVLLEEPLLRKRFGERYERYLRSVPRWIPRPPREPSR